MSLALDMNPACTVAHGVVYRPDGTRRRLPLPTTVHGFTFEPGSIDPATRQASLVAVEIVRRIAPWTTVAVGPRILGPPVPGMTAQLVTHREGVALYAWGGFVHYATGVVGLAAQDPAQVIRLATHEAWHAIDERLSPEARAVVDEGLRPAIYGDECPYLSDPWERRARAFEAWCARAIHGLPAFYPASPMESLFNAAWGGELGPVLAEGCTSDDFPRKRPL